MSQKNQADKTKLRFQAGGRMYQFCISWISFFIVVGWFGGLWGTATQKKGLRLITSHTLEGYLAI